MYRNGFNCTRGPPYINSTHKDLYKKKANLSYPIDVARNVAKEASQTHFVLVADIELYTSVLGTESPPHNKSALVDLLNNIKAFSFHKKICNRCHVTPNLTQWVNLTATKELDVFITTKRQGEQVRWEAVYIGIRDDPSYDERLDWEKHGNKMAQAYTLCILDYNYLVLNNAFLIHKPGIKKKMANSEVIPKTAKYIRTVLGKEIDILLGPRKGSEA